MIATAGLLVLPCLVGDPTVEVDTPTVFVSGESFSVTVAVRAADDGSEVPSWLLEAAAFSIDGKPLGDRSAGAKVNLVAGTQLTLKYDLASAISASDAFTEGQGFELGFGEGVVEVEATKVIQWVVAPKGLDFLAAPEGEEATEGRCWTSDGTGAGEGTPVATADLSKYRVRFLTNRGEMILEVWPDVAPCHARNFLDLVYTGFYDGVIFHRVMPGFMIQGGDPTGTGRGPGPRMMKAEFNKKRHERGVLSMARGPSPDSGSCQFFVMHAAAPHLDGKYSAFGTLLSGFDVLDSIAASPGTPIQGAGGTRPEEPQRIERALVLIAE